MQRVLNTNTTDVNTVGHHSHGLLKSIYVAHDLQHLWHILNQLVENWTEVLTDNLLVLIHDIIIH